MYEIGILLAAMMEVLDYIGYFISNINTMESYFVSFERCNYYLRLKFEKGHHDIEEIEDNLFNPKKLEEIKMRSKLKNKNWPVKG